MTFFIQTLVINGKIFPSPLVLRTRGSGKILPLITRVCMKNVSLSSQAAASIVKADTVTRIGKAQHFPFEQST